MGFADDVVCLLLCLFLFCFVVGGGGGGGGGGGDMGSCLSRFFFFFQNKVVGAKFHYAPSKTDKLSNLYAGCDWVWNVFMDLVLLCSDGVGQHSCVQQRTVTYFPLLCCSFIFCWFSWLAAFNSSLEYSHCSESFMSLLLLCYCCMNRSVKTVVRAATLR